MTLLYHPCSTLKQYTHILKAWESSQRSTKDDWMEWMRVFAIELLKESPSPALRACSILAQKYDHLAASLSTTPKHKSSADTHATESMEGKSSLRDSPSRMATVNHAGMIF
jgi:hypothetical protein